MVNSVSDRVRNKFYVDQYMITSPNYNKENSKILTVGDIHYHENVNKEIYEMLLYYVITTKPDYIVMPGDFIETSGFLNDLKEREYFEYFLRTLAEICPVIMTPGNHEIANFDTKRDRSDTMKVIKYFESLNKYKNIYFLNNEQTKIKDMMFLGFNPRLDYYFKYGTEEGNQMVMEDYLKSGLKMNKDDYNILVSHINPDNYTDIPKTDLVIAGHWHDGYLIKKLDRFFEDTNKGLFITPFIPPHKGLVCRGMHDFGRGYLFVTQGFRKTTADIKLFNFFDKFTANDVEEIIIQKSEDGTKSKVKVRK